MRPFFITLILFCLSTPMVSHAGMLDVIDKIKDGLNGDSKLIAKLEHQLLEHDSEGVHITLEQIRNTNRQLFIEVEKPAKSIDAFMFQLHLFETAENDKEAINLKPSVSSSAKRIPRKIPFSNDFVAAINNKINEFNKKSHELFERQKLAKAEELARREEQKKEAERLRKQQEADEAVRKAEAEEWIKALRAQEAENARLAAIAREKEEEEQKRVALEKKKEDLARQKANELADESVEVQELSLACGICEAIDSNKSVERALAEDKRYARKYGVINLGRRDAAVQVIKANDYSIAELRSEYKQLTHRNFEAKTCRRKDLQSCEESIQKLRSKVAEKIYKTIDKEALLTSVAQ